MIGSNQDAANAIVRILGLEVGIEKQRGAALDPAVLVADTPHGNPDAVFHVQARRHSSLVITRRGALDVELRDRTLARSSTESLQRGGVVRDGPDTGQMRLRADAVDGDAGGHPLGDVGRHSLSLGVGGGVEVVVVDVELCGRVGGTGGLERGRDEALAEDVVEDGGAETAVFAEDLVDDVLSIGLAWFPEM